MKKFLLSVAVAAVAALPGQVAAQSDIADRFATVDEIPAPLLQTMARTGRQTYRENYIVSVMEPLRRTAADAMNLSEKDIQRLAKRNETQRRRQNLQNIIVNDTNFDGTVTRDEIIAVYNERRNE